MNLIFSIIIVRYYLKISPVSSFVLWQFGMRGADWCYSDWALNFKSVYTCRWIGILMENLGALDFSENIQSGRVFYADSCDTAIVGLPQLGGGVDTKRP
jgi:hypothetical protein